MPPTHCPGALVEPDSRWSARRVLLHLIAEIAQHAGHADIIRKSLDGASQWDSTRMAQLPGDDPHDSIRGSRSSRSCSGIEVRRIQPRATDFWSISLGH